MKAKIHVNVRKKINSRIELKKLYLLIKKKKDGSEDCRSP